MSDIRKFLDIINETSAGATASGSVATVAQPMTTTQKRIKEEDKSKTPEVLEYGNWENSALTTSNELKKSRKRAAKIVKSIYGEDTVEEGQSSEQRAAIAIAKKKKVAEGLYDDDGLSYNERYKLSREIEKSPQDVEFIANRLASYVDKMEPEMFTRWGVEFLNDKIQKIARMAIVGRGDSPESLMSKLKSELKKDDEQGVAESSSDTNKPPNFTMHPIDRQDYKILRKPKKTPPKDSKEWGRDGGEKKMKEEVEQDKTSKKHFDRYDKLDKLANKEQGVEEGRFVKGPGGVPLDRHGNPKLPKIKAIKAQSTPTSVAPELSLDAVWRKVEDVVGRIFPDGDPIDYLIPWFKKYGITGLDIGDILERAAKKNGYKDIYDYYHSMGDQYSRDNVAEGLDKNLVYISVDRVEAFEDWMESEGLETDVPKRDEGTYVVYDYSGADHTSKMYADDWNEKKGVAEGWMGDDEPVSWEKGGTKTPTGALGSEQDDPFRGVTPPQGKTAARNAHRLGKTYTNPHSPKYHKKDHAAWEQDYNSEMTRLKNKGVAEGSEETEETAVINMFEKLVKQGRDPIDMIAHKFGWGSYELDQLARNLGFKNSAGWAFAVKQGKGVNEGVAEGYSGRKNEDGTWTVYKDGEKVAGVNPFKNKELAKQWIASAWLKDKDQKQGVAEGYNLDSHIKQTRDRILKYKDWNTTGSHDKKIKELQDKLKELLAQKKQGVAEGYILKKTKVEKTFTPGDPDEYYTSGGADVTTKDTDYEIINNKTGQVVGTASWTTDDYFGPGALKITMKNGATRWLDIWEREKGNPQTAFNRFVKDPKTAKKYKEQGVAEGSLNEFSTGGRDGDDDGDDRGRGLTRQEFKNALKLALGYDMAGVDVSTFEGGMLRIQVNGERRIVPCNKLGVKDATAFVKRIKKQGVAEGQKRIKK